MKSRGAKKAFTLIELLMVVAIISIGTAFIMFSVRNAQSRGRDSQRMADLAAIDAAIQMYYRETGHYPSLPNECGSSYTFQGGSAVYWVNKASSNNVSAWAADKCLTTNFIAGVVPKYIKQLPVDPGPVTGAANQRGYLYVHKVNLTTGAECYKIMAHAPENPTISVSKRIWDPERDSGTNPSIVDGNSPWAWSYYSRGCANDDGTF